MPFWNIGPIKGEFQPEDYTETQETDVDYNQPVGGRHVAVVKGWEPREITISFTVDSLARSNPDSATYTPGSQESDKEAGDLPPGFRADPEEVWKAIQRMQRPADGHVREIAAIPVYIPGWGNEGRNQPTKALIVSASIQRTHLTGQGRGDEQHVRATKAIITVTLKEVARIRRGSAK